MRLHKFTVYMYGFNDEQELTIKDAKEVLSSSRRDVIIQPYAEKSIYMEYIYDNHPLNKDNLKKETWELYMNPKLDELYNIFKKAEKDFKDYRKELNIK